jgi:spermidine synthase
MREDKKLGHFLPVTVAITGALVMVIEITGARIIAPYFGVGLFVWTSLISVTLLALATGYFVGGVLADRRQSANTLYALIGLAGLYVMLIPWFREPVLSLCVPLGLRAGAFVSASILFGPPLFLLGTVSPLAVRLASRTWDKLGRTVGLLYAVSTAGSFIGSVVTGFYLLAHFGVSKTVAITGITLLALSALYFLLIVRRPVIAALALAAPLLLLLTPARPVEAKLADGTIATIIDQRDSFYGHIKVIDYRFGVRSIRELTIDGLVQGGVEPSSGLPIYEYLALLQQLPQQLRPGIRSSLVIGLGAGVLPRSYAAQGLQTEAIDIDPVVLALCRQHFGLPAELPVHLEDARTYLARPGKNYDLIVLDVFSGDTTPAHLLSVEAMHSLKARLNPGGLIAFNLIGSLNAADATLPSIIATARTVLAHAVLYPFFKAPKTEGNVVLIASDAELTPAAGSGFTGPLSPMVEAGVRHALANAMVIGDRFAGQPVLTDDFNPIDTRDQTARDAVRNDILTSTPSALLGGS